MNGPTHAPSSRQSAPQGNARAHGQRDAERGSRRRTGVRDLTQWAVTAACTTVVCATRWPIPTLITTGALAVPAFIAVEIRAHHYRAKHDQEQQ